MAKTGINIQVQDTVLGTPVDRNAVSAIAVLSVSLSGDASSAAAIKPTMKFKAQLTDVVVYEIRKPLSDDEVKSLLGGTFGDTHIQLRTIINDFYHPAEGLDNEGKILYVFGAVGTPFDIEQSALAVYTAIKEFPIAPRQVMLADIGIPDPYEYPQGVFGYDQSFSWLTAADGWYSHLRDLWNTGTFTVMLANSATPTQSELADYDLLDNGFLALVNCYSKSAPSGSGAYPASDRSGCALGMLAAVSVGQSIGDCSLPPLSSDLGVLCVDVEDEVSKFLDVKGYISNDLSEPAITSLYDNQVVFPCSRQPRTGKWFNDGATRNNPDNALSTLEAVRTLAAICDDLQDYFTTYINGRVPVTASGDIQPTFKQVVLDNARAKVIDKYIASGDISDARVSLVAKDNDMVGTRTWEVSVSILPAPTLRWIEGYVFYVNKLS